MIVIFMLLLFAYGGAVMLLVMFPDRVTRDEDRRHRGGQCLLYGFVCAPVGITAAAFLPGLAGTVTSLLAFTASAAGLVTGLLQDSFSGGLLGMNGFSKPLVVFLAARARERPP